MDAKRAPFQFSPPGRALFHFRASEDSLQSSYGAPHYAPGGPRRLPAWGFEFSDGLILELQVNDEAGLCYVHGPLRELRRAIMLLSVDDRIVWRMDDDWTTFERALEAYHPADWGRWRVHVDGSEAIECLSPGEADLRAEHIEANGQGPARIEESPITDARARRKRILNSGKAQRRLPGEHERQRRWEVWQIGPGDTASLLAMFPAQADAESFRTDKRTKPHSAEVRYEVRLRSGVAGGPAGAPGVDA